MASQGMGADDKMSNKNETCLIQRGNSSQSIAIGRRFVQKSSPQANP